MPTQIEIQGAIKLRKLAQLLLPRKAEDRLLLKLFPVVAENEVDLVYERRGVYTGVQHARGKGGPTGPAAPPGVDSFRVSPGYYGDHYTIEEDQLVALREVGDWQLFQAIPDQMAKASEHLVDRYLNRLELSIGTLLTTGGFTAGNVKTGQTYHQEVYNLQQFTPGVLFSDLANSAPLKYLRDLIPQLELARSVSFGAKGKLLMSRPTLNLILSNANSADLGGKRIANGGTLNSLDDVNEVLVANDIPPAEIYDGAYYPDGGGSPVRFIPNGKIVVCGNRTDGAPMGEYAQTRAAQNENSAPGEWYTVEDFRKTTRPRIVMGAGHNGGPRLLFPETVAVINAAAPF